MARIIINGTEIGDGNKPYIIAEGCDNHIGDLVAAKEIAF